MRRTFFKDVELFRALEQSPKEPDTMTCEKCDGYGKCEHCGADCDECDASGQVPDYSQPEVYTFNKSRIVIGEHHFSPYMMGKLEKVLVETFFESFSVIKKSKLSLLIRVGEIEILLARIADEEDKRPIPAIHLKPIENAKEKKS